MGNREEKEIRRIEMGKEEVKLSLFTNYIILYIDNPKDTNRKLLELINEFSKAAKLIYINPSHFCTLTMKFQKEKLRKQSHLPSHQKE